MVGEASRNDIHVSLNKVQIPGILNALDVFENNNFTGEKQNAGCMQSRCRACN